MIASSQQPTLGDYIRVVRRRKWVVLAGILILALAGALYAAHRGVKHTTTIEVATAFLQPPTSSGGSPGGGSSGSAADARYLANEAAFARSAAIIGETTTLARTGRVEIAMPKPARPVVLTIPRRVDISPRQLASSSSVTPSATSDILDITVTRRGAADSAALAQAYAEVYVAMRRQQIEVQYQPYITRLNDQIAKINRQIANPATSKNTIRSIRPALVLDIKNLQPIENYVTQAKAAVRVQPTTSSTTAVKLSPVKYGLGAGAVGLVLGLIIAFVWDAIDNGARTREEFAGSLDLPVLANLPTPPRRLRANHGLVSLEPGEATAESFRLLAVRLDLLATRSNARSILVTSALDEEGKSTTAANLGVALAQLGKSVVLVDSDLLRPTAARFFAAHGEVGLFDVLSSGRPVEDVLVEAELPASRTALGRLRIVPPGHIQGDATGLLASERLGEVMNALEAAADYVIVDSPPVLTVSHATVWSARVDAILVIARADRVTPELTRDLRAALDGLPAPAIGAVLTGVDGGSAYPYYGRPYNPLPGHINGNGIASALPQMLPGQEAPGEAVYLPVDAPGNGWITAAEPAPVDPTD